ncbi:vWA domain-containing protein [Streptacidiphilus melanogenes]|uniref:vWA domain-containing protein n=1 Tax=Streptacidiphilus melanogenes TaxID=411235 RepID=UPI000693DB65|nr:VWA domain-containing protein [Streptacidiphilus melanogenes]
MTESHVAPPAFDRAEFAARLGAELRRAGLPADPERAARFQEASRLLPPVDRTALYWSARLAFVTGREQIEPFDRVFARLFGGPGDAAARVGDVLLPGQEPGPPASADRAPTAPPPGLATSALPHGVPRADRSEERAAARERTETGAALRLLGSREELLAHRDLGTFGADDVADLDRLLDSLAFRLPLRRTRRRQRDPHGRSVDLRRSLRRSLGTGGETLTLARSHGRMRRRPLVLLCDISGSMEPYTRAYLLFFAKLGSTARAGGRIAVESFVFATRLTRLTPVLRHTTPDAALRAAGRTASDWSGGTLIARCLAAFIDGFGPRGMARGAVVVIFSDGWEAADPAGVGQQMARLRRLAHRIVWVNPRKAAPGYAPLTGGMAAALPYCDAFVSGHTIAALGEVMAAIADPGSPWPQGRAASVPQGAGRRP